MKKIPLTTKQLQDLYWKKRRSAYQIARDYNCSEGTVRARMREAGIAIRDQRISHTKYETWDFSGDPYEKAYLIGFRLGDLNVYKTTPTSPIIITRCSTTQWQQIELLHQLFSPYGEVTTSKGKESYCVNCRLNTTFNFLLPKSNTVPDWITNHPGYALAFSAGYIDADGSMGLNQGKARLKIDSYDIGILKWMYDFFQDRNINIKLRHIADPVPGKYKKSLWRVNINEAYSLSYITTLLRPYLRHATRIEQANTCRINVLERLKAGTVSYAHKY